MPKTSWIALLAPVLLSTTACGSGSGEGDSAGNDGLTTFNTSFDTSFDTGEGEDDPTGNDGTVKLDTLEDDEGRSTAGNEEGGAKGCKAIDFLFVIDNSGSMGDNQTNLISSFPGFIQKIQEVVADVDSYHVMVVKTDELWNSCQIECAFFPFLCQFGDINACNGAPSICDDTMGAGVNFPIGGGASNQYCELTGGQRYITPQEPLDLLPSKFTCTAKVGTDGSGSEKQMEAMTEALSPALNGPGGCNSGFLRDDAVLVITIITDEEDSHSSGTPDSWYQSVIAQKGDPDGVVVLGLINDTDAGNPVCPAESQDPAKIREFIQKFPHQIIGSVCEANYAPFFNQAVDLIDTTCDEFDPIG
ncbi:MAG: hypothetical protein R6X02_03180 [Enhygromyxa sp.]